MSRNHSGVACERGLLGRLAEQKAHPLHEDSQKERNSTERSESQGEGSSPGKLYDRITKSSTMKNLLKTNKMRARWNITKTGLDVSRFLFKSTLPLKRWFLDSPDEILMAWPKNDWAMKAVTNGYSEKDRQKANKYINKTLNRLHQLAIEGDMTKFQRYARKISSKSKLLKLYRCTNGVKDWWDLSDKQKAFAWRKSNELIKRGKYEFKFKRVMIPKPGTTVMRPLSVPELEWRIISKWYLDLFQIWIQPREEAYLDKNQLGGRVGKNTTDAWNLIWGSLLKKPYVAEFDLAKCFDAFYHFDVSQRLFWTETPHFLHNFIMGVLDTAIENVNPQEAALERVVVENATSLHDAPILRRVQGWRKWLEYWLGIEWEEPKHITELRKQRLWADGVRTRQAWPGGGYLRAPYLWQDNGKEPPTPKPEGVPEQVHKIMNMRMLMEDDWKERGKSIWINKYWMVQPEIIGRGLPQGWALSPLLSNIMLRGIVLEGKGLLYLDDGILAADDPKDMELEEILERLHNLGGAFAPHKFAWIKWNGVWERPLRFLGLQTDGESMQAYTRGGSRAELQIPSIGQMRKGTSQKGAEIPNTFEWTKRFNEMTNGPLTETMTAWLYNNGRVWDSNGKDTEWGVPNAWAKSLRTKKMRKWMSEYPSNAANLVAAIKEAQLAAQKGTDRSAGYKIAMYQNTLRTEKAILKRLRREEDQLPK